ncbi:DUF2812 domain-containing protein [Exiguobacterium chiriqhucha]|uniref:DUF2812 domain-containing protein n=1 Tax=Exiguobacterium chiriqhucha RW-2 TaxID=1345023 RepID=U1LXS8_9BACL|nr:DUF2812 domain-containing protein [Exiguobacterium chiriqhucha]ERG67484.1 hypothetical protein M467_09355 [Exiguobacterium chiriqhucha RW-2]
MKRKYMSSWGLAFAEEREMKKLGEMAARGWHLEKFAPLGYTLVEGEPMDVRYSLDYRKQPDEDYFELFAASGWEHVTSTGDEIHVFKGSPDATPLYTDRQTTQEKYGQVERTMGRGALICLLLFLGFVFMLQLDWPQTAEAIILVLQTLVVIGLVFTGLPYLGFLVKRKRLERNE